MTEHMGERGVEGPVRMREKLHNELPRHTPSWLPCWSKYRFSGASGAWLKTPGLCHSLLLTVCGCGRQSCADAAVQHPARARPGAALQPGACFRMLQDGGCSVCADK